MSSVTSSKHAKYWSCIIMLAIYRSNTFECHISLLKNGILLWFNQKQNKKRNSSSQWIKKNTTKKNTFRRQTYTVNKWIFVRDNGHGKNLMLSSKDSDHINRHKTYVEKMPFYAARHRSTIVLMALNFSKNQSLFTTICVHLNWKYKLGSQRCKNTNEGYVCLPSVVNLLFTSISWNVFSQP